MNLDDLGLSRFLLERTRQLNQAAAAAGDFVLYWMHHAVRAEENPALDLACQAAASLDVPLLVYQGLGGSHPHNNDRHHTFILEGAKAVAEDLARRGIRHVFHLPSDAQSESPLPGLARSSRVLVTEDFPVAPFPAWSLGLARDSGTDCLLVDTACIVPMRLAGKRYERAFQFRKDQEKAFAARVDADYPSTADAPAPYQGPLPFSPVDWTHPIPTLVSRCEIDHSVGPVHQTPGGSVEGYRRWEAFRTDGLSTYHRQRNNAALDGVSRLSPYLHHGFVSPFRIGREASRTGGGGADKFLDELLIWRELAFNYCFHTPNVHSLEAIPDWARRTLEEHADDPRVLPGKEALHRGRAGDPLWDAAQRSLLQAGELHNNVRMTWGKRILDWTEGPADALDTLYDLNNRFALDGSDPNSTGGLLWCLGLFDRPFPPEKPVLGLVRPRSSEAHAQRLDLQAFSSRVSSQVVRPRVAVIGAGLAGLSAGRTLQDNGCEVVLFDKGRRPGGRLASRRQESWSFDHGAQYFTAKDPRFNRQVQQWLEVGVVNRWDGAIGVFDGQRITSAGAGHERFVGTPENNSLAAHVAMDLDVRASHKVTGLSRVNGRWEVTLDDGMATHNPGGAFDAVIVALPAEQTATLVGDQIAIPSVTMDPCWTLMLGLHDALPIKFDGVFVNSGPISWMARGNSKPGREHGESWVIQAGPEWSARNLERPPDDIVAELIEAASIVSEAPPRPAWQRVHRWRYAQGATSAPEQAVWDSSIGLALAGDWLGGGRIEGAWLSGIAAAGFILRDPSLQQVPAGSGQADLFG
ncbi:MAG: NAD(P)-binding protein [Rhodothermales bacterium]|nr:NAD(P)-binding protein [Rhodothermales bacterium]